MGSGPAQLKASEAAFEAAIKLYENVAPRDPGHVTALIELGVTYFYRGDVRGAIALYQRALKADETVDGRDDGEMQTIYGNLGIAYMNVGEFVPAVSAYQGAAELAERTYGKQHKDYWYPAANHARVLHLSGERLRADAMYEALIGVMPDPATNLDAMVQTESYGTSLSAEGRPELALRWLEPAERMFQRQRHADNDLRRIRLALGDAYDRLGRFADARRTLQGAVDEFAAVEPVDKQTAMAARERWGRFLLTQGELGAAQSQFESVVAQDHDRHFAHTALAQAGLGAVALAQGQTARARDLITDAWQRWHDVRGFRDVRMGPYLRRLLARALLAAGDTEAARSMAQAALEESLRFDAPEAASIAEARGLLQQAAPQAAKR
jgi:serine/threonine-protein kinase